MQFGLVGPRTRRRVMAAAGRRAVVALLVGVAVAGCSSGPATSAGAPATSTGRPAVVTVPSTTAGTPGGPAVAGRLRDAAAALCVARRDAGDRRAARRVFYDRSHQQLHELASAAEPVDRAMAARLLEAKEQVEAHLDRPARAPRLAGDLDRLFGAAAAALRALSISPPSCAG